MDSKTSSQRTDLTKNKLCNKTYEIIIKMFMTSLRYPEFLKVFTKFYSYATWRNSPRNCWIKNACRRTLNK